MAAPAESERSELNAELFYQLLLSDLSLQNDDPASAFAVDAAVRGRDRQLGDDIDALAAHVADIAAKELQAAAEASAALYASLRKAVLIIGTLAVLSALWLVFAANRAARS